MSGISFVAASELAEYNSKMKNKLFTLSLIVLTSLSSLCFAQTQKFRGVARNNKGEIAYIEQHEILYNKNGLVEKVITRYLRPKDESVMFAKLESYFDQATNYVPRSIFTDLRFQQKEETKISDDKKKLEIIHTDLKTDKSKSKTLDISDSMVMGQGYHNYILTNFENFKKGEKRTLDFVVPARQDFYRFDLTYVGLLEKENRKVFRLDITSWVLRLFADKILVTYDAATKRLMSYEGLTNITDDQGKNQSLTISMEYEQ